MARPASWLPPLSPSDGLVGPSMTNGLLSESLWRRPLDRDGANAPSRPESRSQSLAPIARQMDDTNILPDAVVNLFRESLDDEGLGFLKHGPRSPLERLAFAQRVNPHAHLSSSPAPATEQGRFRGSGAFDSNRHFVGPDRRVYLRNGGTDEPLAYSLRRGIENAAGGFGQPELPEIIEASFRKTQGGAGTDQLQRRRQAQNWPGATLTPEDSVAPLPPRIPEVKAISSKFRQIERDVREQGLTVGAGALKHFMDGGGLPVQYDQAQFRSFPVVQEAEHGIQKHFADWILGTHPKRAVIAGKAAGYVDSGLEQIKTDLLRMKDGDTLHRGSHWDAQLPYPKLTRLPFEATVGTPSADANLYGATGDAMLRSDGGFTFHRTGNRIEFKGAVEHNFDERFDFELDGRPPFYAPAKGSIIPWEITQEEGVAMQNSGLGTPFRTSARWDQPVSGVLTSDSNGVLRLDHIEWGGARARRPRRGR